MNIKKIEEQSRIIKLAFQEIERKPWRAKEFGIELIVQVGHLADIMSRQSHKLNKYSDSENKKILGDELADILLNLFSICIESNITPTESLKTYRQQQVTDGYQHLVLILKHISEINTLLRRRAENDSRNELQDELLKSFELTIDLIYFYEIDINAVYNVMMNESLLFVKKHSK